MGRRWQVKPILMKVKQQARPETIVLSLMALYRWKGASSKVDVPKLLPGGHAVAADAVVVVAAIVR